MWKLPSIGVKYQKVTSEEAHIQQNLSEDENLSKLRFGKIAFQDVGATLKHLPKYIPERLH